MEIMHPCPVEVAVNLVGDKWKVLILRNLIFFGTQRFSELSKGIDGISQKMLAQQLRRMETDGLVSRKVYAEIPPRVEYSLTDLGISFKPIFEAMYIWGENYIKSQF